MTSQNSTSKFIAAIWALTIGALFLAAHGQIAVRNQGFIPYSDEPISYRAAEVSDPVAFV